MVSEGSAVSSYSWVRGHFFFKICAYWDCGTRKSHQDSVKWCFFCYWPLLKGPEVGVLKHHMWVCEACPAYQVSPPMGLLVEFHQHVTGLYIIGWRLSFSPPKTFRYGFVEVARAAFSEPPAIDVTGCTATTGPSVVVAVRSAEHLSIGCPPRHRRSSHRITGISAVPGHRQPVLTDLITDGERRVFSRVPQTRSTLDLLTGTIML